MNGAILMADVAWLVLSGLNKSHTRASAAFDKQGGYGAYTVKDCLERGGIETDFCSPSTAKNYRVVLVPLVFTSGIADFLKAVIPHDDWQPGARSFKVVVGGFGVHNVYPYREYADAAVFGRCEEFIVDLVCNLLDGKQFQHKSVMNLPDIYPVEYGQASELYPHCVMLGNGKTFKETSIGCSRACLFCHYRWTRKHVGGLAYDMQQVSGAASVETTIWDVFDIWDRKKAKVRFGIDGNSERLRMAFGKPITNAMLVETIERISAEATCSPTVRPEIYTIGSYPTESEEDRNELGRVLSRCKCCGVPVKMMVQLTPFRPSLMTPSQWEAANVVYNWNLHAVTNIASVEGLEVYYRYSIEGPASLLEQMIFERASEGSDQIIKTVLFSPQYKRLKSREKVQALSATFNIAQYIQLYEIGDTLPTSYLSSYTENEKLEMAAKNLRVRLSGI